MKDKSPHDPLNMIGEAYELCLEKVIHGLHIQDGAPPHKATISVKLSSNHQPKDTPPDWVDLEKDIIKASLLELINDAGDKTTVALKRLNNTSTSPTKSKRDSSEQSLH